MKKITEKLCRHCGTREHPVREDKLCAAAAQLQKLEREAVYVNGQYHLENDPESDRYRATLAACPDHPKRNGDHRGRCKQCYDTLAQRVHRGTTTWAELEAAGIVAPAKPTGRPRKYFKPVAK